MTEIIRKQLSGYVFYCFPYLSFDCTLIKPLRCALTPIIKSGLYTINTLQARKNTSYTFKNFLSQRIFGKAKVALIAPSLTS